MPTTEPALTLCFLFAYFEHNGEDGLRLAWSDDALKWHPLNDGKSVLAPTIGEAKIMRDPCLIYGPDETFHLVWTTGWTGQTIGYASSRDLKNWSVQKELPVMAHEPETKNCWAPEVIWDNAAEHYLIFWSSTIPNRFPETEDSNVRPNSDFNWKRNHRIYSTTTKDWENFTPTRLHYDGGFNVIDANLAQNDDEWLMFVKNESYNPKIEKNIRLVHAQTPDGQFSEASPAISGNYWAEGPAAIKVGDEWWVYFDKHQENKYGLVCSSDLENWVDRSDEVSFPDNARHGTVLQAPRAILKPFLQDK